MYSILCRPGENDSHLFLSPAVTEDLGPTLIILLMNSKFQILFRECGSQTSRKHEEQANEMHTLSIKSLTYS